ncbi:hypothetical protein GCM10017687_64270 [Streptomyces echinatus]
MVRDLVADHLDGDEPPARRTAEVDLPHPARAESGEKCVRTYVRGVLRLECVHGTDPATQITNPSRTFMPRQEPAVASRYSVSALPPSTTL